MINCNLKENIEIRIDGYKHSLIMIFCIILLLNIDVFLDNVPNIKERKVILKICDLLGKKYELYNNGIYFFKSQIKNVKLENDLTNQIHGTIYLLPVLLYHFRKIDIFESGGCRIGDANTYSTRPIKHVLTIMEKFGAYTNNFELNITQSYQSTEVNIMDYSVNKEVMCGPYVSGATKTAILCALVANGKTIIKNPYMKADVLEMLKFIRFIGGSIVYENDELTVYPITGDTLSIRYSICPDVTEIITYIAFSQYHKISLKLTNISFDIVDLALKDEFNYIKMMGINLCFGEDYIQVVPTKSVRAVDIVANATSIYSDSHPFFTLMLLDAKDNSSIQDDVWNNRLSYARELQRVGEGICLEGQNKILIIPSKRREANNDLRLIGEDLRGVACLLIYSSKYKGAVVEGIEHIERGYEDFWMKLNALGVQFQIEL